MTYESASEAAVLKSYWRPGAALENTLFILLDPYGRPLTQASREPSWLYRDAREMALSLDDIARRYSGRGENQNLPVVATVRLALNVAAADKLPLAIIVSDRSQERQAMEKKLAPLSWRSELIGKVTYTSAAKNELSALSAHSALSTPSALSGVSISRGYVFVAPNEFGTSVQVLAQLNADASAADLERALKQTIYQHRPSNIEYREHIRMGMEEGIKWTSAIPVTDPASLRHDHDIRNRPGHQRH